MGGSFWRERRACLAVALPRVTGYRGSPRRRAGRPLIRSTRTLRIRQTYGLDISTATTISPLPAAASLAQHDFHELSRAGGPGSTDLADVSRQPRPGPGLDRFPHGAHGGLAGALRPRRARPPSPAGPPLRRDRAPHRGLDGPTDRGGLPGRHRTGLPPPRSRPSLWRCLPPPREGHGHR